MSDATVSSCIKVARKALGDSGRKQIYLKTVQTAPPTPRNAPHRIYKRLLTEYGPPPLDIAIKEELEAFVAKRKERGGAPAN